MDGKFQGEGGREREVGESRPVRRGAATRALAMVICDSGDLHRRWRRRTLVPFTENSLWERRSLLPDSEGI